MGKIDARYTAKIPVQARSKERFNKILSIAEALAIEVGIDQVSPHKIAKLADIPPASVYQYFPTMGALFSTMAEIHFVQAFDMVEEYIAERNINQWQDLAIILVDVAYDFYTQDKISEMLFLSNFSVSGVRELSATRLTRLGGYFVEKFAILHKKSELEPLAEKMAICIEVMKGVYIRSLSVHKEIKPNYKQEAQALVLGYLEPFFSNLDKSIKKAQ